MPVPFKRANFKRGQTFVCQGCSRTLRTNKGRAGMAMATFALASLAGKVFGFLAVAAVLIALIIVEWLTVRVSLTEDAETPAQ
ncbi:MAG TPA: hypothetical protein VFS87_11185 [Qipengyuania sp.]|nr:hypothetical protein [Qipengyuania sp.]